MHVLSKSFKVLVAIVLFTSFFITIDNVHFNRVQAAGDWERIGNTFTGFHAGSNLTYASVQTYGNTSEIWWMENRVPGKIISLNNVNFSMYDYKIRYTRTDNGVFVESGYGEFRDVVKISLPSDQDPHEYQLSAYRRLRNSDPIMSLSTSINQTLNAVG